MIPLTLKLNASVASSSPLDEIYISYHRLHGPKLSTLSDSPALSLSFKAYCMFNLESVQRLITESQHPPVPSSVL